MVRGTGRAILLAAGAIVAFGFSVAVSGATTKGLPAPLVFTDDFEDGLTNGKGWVISGNAPTISTDVARTGTHSLKTYLNRQTSQKSVRTEVSGNFIQTLPGEHYWYGFSIYLPSSYVSDNIWEIVAQWHSSTDISRGEQNYIQNPPLSLQTANGIWKVSTIWDSKPVTTKDTYEGTLGYPLGAYQTNKWTDWVFHIKWSPYADGILQVWKDGQQVIDKKGPIGYNDLVAPYFKMGLYKGWGSRVSPAGNVGQRTLYHDAFKFAVGASAKYSDVAPGGKSDDSTDDPKPRPPSSIELTTN